MIDPLLGRGEASLQGTFERRKPWVQLDGTLHFKVSTETNTTLSLNAIPEPSLGIPLAVAPPVESVLDDCSARGSMSIESYEVAFRRRKQAWLSELRPGSITKGDAACLRQSAMVTIGRAQQWQPDRTGKQLVTSRFGTVRELRIKHLGTEQGGHRVV